MIIKSIEASILTELVSKTTLFYTVGLMVEATGLHRSVVKRAFHNLEDEHILEVWGSSRQRKYKLSCIPYVGNVDFSDKNKIEPSVNLWWNLGEFENCYGSILGNTKTAFLTPPPKPLSDSDRKLSHSFVFSRGMYIYSITSWRNRNIFNTKLGENPKRKRHVDTELTRERKERQNEKGFFDPEKWQDTAKEANKRHKKVSWQTDVIFLSMAKRLADYIKGWKGHVDRKGVEDWTDDFYLMVTRDKISPKVLELVLTWYITKMEARRRQTGLPNSITSGAMYRKHFNWIFSQYQPERKTVKLAGAGLRARDDAIRFSMLSESRIPPESLNEWLMACNEKFTCLRLALLKMNQKIEMGQQLRAMIDSQFAGGQLEFLYLIFMLELTVKWNGWTYSLDRFYPGEVYFWEFFGHLSQSRWGRWIKNSEKLWIGGLK